jgi:hypothetical protein
MYQGTSLPVFVFIGAAHREIGRESEEQILVLFLLTIFKRLNITLEGCKLYSKSYCI